MASCLPEGQGVYSVNMDWLCDIEQKFTVEQLAQGYIEIVQKIQAKGPYYFCGYSFGGLVAYEMAVRLIDEGDCVNLVALLDTPNPALMANLSKADSTRYRRTYLIDRLGKYAGHLRRADIGAFARRGFAFVVSRLGRFFMPAIKTGFRTINKPLPRPLRANDPGFQRAGQAYSPKRYTRSLVLFRVQDRGPEDDDDLSMGWDACVTCGVEVHVVPGDHIDMMIMPSAGIIARQLSVHLGRPFES
jgi:thioesterase domain-containing protein